VVYCVILLKWMLIDAKSRKTPYKKPPLRMAGHIHKAQTRIDAKTPISAFVWNRP
jgi:hypothetical protein